MEGVGSRSTRIALIGGGKMGEAIVSGLIAALDGEAASLRAENFVVADPSEQRRSCLAAAYGVACVEDAQEIDRADLAILAVKPQVMQGVLADIARDAPFARPLGAPLFVSIAAGLTTSAIESGLGEGARVVRTMPNLPLQAGLGATAVVGGVHATETDVTWVKDLFSSLGFACVVDESDMDAVCAISGSGPAYVAAVIEALAAAGARSGLDADLARDLALQTVYGTAKILVNTACDIGGFREAVCSPGGTTIAALDAMAERGLDAVFDAGVQAAIRRSKELASS